MTGTPLTHRPMRVIRDVTPDECPWLERTFKEGETVYRYHGFTYGCISALGVAITVEPNKTPFIELPINALNDLTETRAREEGVY